MKILFYGFQHGHIFNLYNKVKDNPSLEIVACLEDDAKKREELKETRGIICSTESLEYWLEKGVDIVAVGDKYGKRGPAIIKALKSGSHVIADKPICTTMAQLEEIKELSLKNNLKVACMLDLRYFSSTQIVKKLIEDNAYGEVKNISFTGQHCIDYAHRPTWYFEEGMHGGTINDLAIHGIDMLYYLTGLKISKIHSARCWNSFADRTPDFLDCAMFMLELENKAGVIADVSYSAPSQVFTMPTYWDFKIWCKNGMIHYNITSNKVTVYAEGEEGPKTIEFAVPESDYLKDLLNEIKTGASDFTNSVLLATEQTLKIQQYSEK